MKELQDNMPAESVEQSNQLPTADDFFAAPKTAQQTTQEQNTSANNNQPNQLPTADDFFKPQKPSIAVDPNPVSSPAMDDFFQKSAPGRIASAFGAAFIEGGQGGALGIEPGGDVENALKKYGIFNDYAKGQNDIGKAFNEALIRPAAVVLDNEFRGAQATMGAVGAGIQQASTEIDKMLPEKVQGLLPELTEYFLTTPAGVEIHAIPPDIVHARSVGAIGESEASYFGLKEPTPEQQLERDKAAAVAPQEAFAEAAEKPLEQPIETQTESPEPPKDIHAIAREIAPDTFKQYDSLQNDAQWYRNTLNELSEKRDANFQDNPPNIEEMQDVQSKIDTLLGKVNGVESRLTKTQSAKLEDLRSQHEDLANDALNKSQADTADMREIREKLRQTDYQMRDIAPDVSAAYRDAQSRLPAEERKEEPTTITQEPQSEEAKPEEPTASSENVESAKPITDQLKSISEDVVQKLTAAGRPAEEANAASQLIAEHYKAIADQGWAKGTPEEIYQKDAPSIIGSNRITKNTPGKIRIMNDARNAITLFKNANASTFLHETGHAWLDEMMRYAKEDDAPATLLKDRDTVNKWLGVKDGEGIARAQHEKFARGFERYLMEGTAPSKELAAVFAKFKQWLTDIYQTVLKLKSPITDDIRDVFDRLLSSNPEKTIIAPEREIEPVEPGTSLPTEQPKENASTVEPTPQESGPAQSPTMSPKTKPVPRPEKAPPSLLEWISKNGGIKDTGGDLKAMGAGEWHKGKVGMGKLIKDKGMNADDAALKAWQEGYFPEAAEGERPTIQDLHDKIDAELRGNKQYPNNFIKELAEDPEYINHISEQMSIEEQQNLNLEIADYKDALYKELDRQVEESRGDAWEPESEEPNTVTLEDLENERRQERDAATTQESQGDNGQPTSAPEAQGNSDQSLPSGGSIAELAGRTGETPDEAAVNPKNQTGYYIGKDGKLNKDALNYSLYNNTPGWMENYFNEYAEKNHTNFNNEASEIETLSSMEALVKASGWTPDEIRNMEIGQKQNRLQQLASADLFKQLVEDTKAKAAEAAASGDPKVIAAFFESTQEHSMLMQAFRDQKAYAAEASRNLGIRRAIKSITGDAEQFADLFQKITDIDPKDLKKQADFLDKLTLPGQAEKFLKDGAQTPWEKFKSQLLEYYINALISGPLTHLRYAAGNALNAIWTPLVEIPTAAGIGRLRETITGEQIADRVYLGEAGAQLHGIIQGSKNGLQAAATAWKTGVSPALEGEIVNSDFANKTKAIPGTLGGIINTAGRGVSAIHSFFKAIRYEQNIQGLAYRNAIIEGLKEGTDEFTNRVADLGVNPTKEMMESATQDALKELYMTPTEYNSFAGKLTSAINNNLAAKIIVPFMKIGSQITRNAFIERTPLGLLTDDVRNNAFYKEGGAIGDMQLAKMTTGVALMGGLSALTLEGLATGDGPTDPKKRAVWLLDHRPNSIQIGNLMIPYQGLGSLGMLMRFAANMTETAQGWNDEDGDKLAKSFVSLVEGINKSVLDDNWMRGLKDMLDAVYHYQEYGANYMQQFATNWLPFSVGMGQVARMVDPSQREAHDIFEAAQAKIPFASEGLFPRRNVFGQVMPNGVDEKYASDPVVQRLESLQTGIGKIDKKINGVKLTEKQFDDYSRLAGNQTYMRLSQYVAIPQTRNLPAAIQLKTIQGIIESSRAQARQIVMMNNPDIYKQATANKIKGLR